MNDFFNRLCKAIGYQHVEAMQVSCIYGKPASSTYGEWEIRFICENKPTAYLCYSSIDGNDISRYIFSYGPEYHVLDVCAYVIIKYGNSGSSYARKKFFLSFEGEDRLMPLFHQQSCAEDMIAEASINADLFLLDN